MDETSFQRRHEYVTVVNDLTTSEPRVLYVADGRAGAALDGYFDALGEAGCGRIQMVGDGHVAGLHPVGVRAHGGSDRVRQVSLGAAPGDGGRQGSTVGEPSPTTTRRRPDREDALPVADTSGEHDAAATPGVHAVAPELVAGGAGVGDQGTRDAAVGLPLAGLGGAHVAALVRVGDSQSPRAHEEGRAKVARMIKRHWDGVIDAVMTNVTNARSEATNTKFQWIERLGCGYRNRERFRNALYFHPGGLDLHPDGVVTHTNS